MRRRIAGLAAAGLLAAVVAVVAPASPAAATDICGGQATAIVAPGLLYPFAPTVTTSIAPPTLIVSLAGSTTSGFSLSLNAGTGVCALGGGLTVGGTLSGYCGHSAGAGTTSDGHRFGWTSAGGFMVVTGGLVGVARVDPDIFGTQSCVTGATSFIVTGVVALIHCNIKTKSSLLQVILPSTWTLTPLPPNGTLHFGYGAISVHHYFKICLQTGVL